MKRPYIVCHIMTSLDGRIDCKMTEQLPGVEDYYSTLEKLELSTTVSGRVTAEFERALTGSFEENDKTPYNKAFQKKRMQRAMRLLPIQRIDSSGRIRPTLKSRIS